ncbi:phage integrase [Kushneria aurantia]|uniref:Tyrosine-type recombinase/integrase n=1 Tax=Kushneria aurantia TaxID=504092 RepID=A0ABV6G1W6_9GAMM|nr:tyrosine-type recombinase/integrase [Kushneria aurantia]
MIRKVTSGWQVDIQPEGRSGRRIRKTFRTRAEAKRFENAVRARAAAGEEYQPRKRDRRRLRDLAQFWYDVHGSSLKDGNVRLQKLRVLADQMGNPPVVSITPTDVARLRAERLQRGLKANTVNHDIAYLRAVLNVAIRMKEWAGENPFAAVSALRLPASELSWLNQEQIDTLFRELRASRSRNVLTITELCLYTGARWSEAQHLRAENVRNCSVTYVHTKNGRSRTVPIDSTFYDRLRSDHPRSGRLFPQDAYRAFSLALERTGIILPKGQRSHVLRHTFASHFIMNGGNLLTLQRILGHQTIQMTMRYAHLSPDHLIEAVKYSPRPGVDTMSTPDEKE